MPCRFFPLTLIGSPMAGMGTDPLRGTPECEHLPPLLSPSSQSLLCAHPKPWGDNGSPADTDDEQRLRPQLLQPLHHLARCDPSRIADLATGECCGDEMNDEEVVYLRRCLRIHFTLSGYDSRSMWSLVDGCSARSHKQEHLHSLLLSLRHQVLHRDERARTLTVGTGVSVQSLLGSYLLAVRSEDGKHHLPLRLHSIQLESERTRTSPVLHLSHVAPR
ncbi:hypothetical protein PMAYCL1PPCAC_23121 [Pristionchus mayeri]|uniref:Uncharacterized protein n=1 Tax=Pristionchus mayeri TaxID=1317129 RepID=A0AAN5CXH2_9BILA|nr:hypothetical protein PMAYCL1PPCAC_23121 [Pristionchus mayeri]